MDVVIPFSSVEKRYNFLQWLQDNTDIKWSNGKKPKEHTPSKDRLVLYIDSCKITHSNRIIQEYSNELVNESDIEEYIRVNYLGEIKGSIEPERVSKMSNMIKETKGEIVKGAKRATSKEITNMVIERLKEKIGNEQFNSILDSELGKALAPIILLKVGMYVLDGRKDPTSNKVRQFCAAGSEEFVQDLVETLLPEAMLLKGAIYAAADYLEDGDND